jgi:hypothetical protein
MVVGDESGQLLNVQETARVPTSVGEILSKAAVEKSTQLLLLQVGHISATITVTLRFIASIVIVLPQSLDR